jgi:hypothetical protein
MAHVMICILVPMDVMGWGRAGCYAGEVVTCLRGSYANGVTAYGEGGLLTSWSAGSTGVPDAINFFGLFNIFPRSPWPAFGDTGESPACRLVHALPDLHSTIQNLGAADRIHVSSFLLASPERFPLLFCLL